MGQDGAEDWSSVLRCSGSLTITPPPSHTHAQDDKEPYTCYGIVGTEKERVEKQEGEGGGGTEMSDGLPVDCEEEELRFRIGELGVWRRRYWAWWFLGSQLSNVFSWLLLLPF